MAARAIGSGTISFGLVNIPVKLYAAAESAAQISFNQLHDKCKSRIKQQLWCPVDNEIVPRDHLVKGYEFAKDQYVIFTAEELKALEEKATQAVEIAEFVPTERIDPIYFDKPYYLAPDRGGEKAYRLLVEAMKKTGRAALAIWSPAQLAIGCLSRCASRWSSRICRRATAGSRPARSRGRPLTATR